MLPVHDACTNNTWSSLNQHVMIYIYIQILFGCQTELYYLQVSGPLLLPLALGHRPVFSSPSLQLMTTRQCCLEETNHDIA